MILSHTDVHYCKGGMLAMAEELTKTISDQEVKDNLPGIFPAVHPAFRRGDWSTVDIRDDNPGYTQVVYQHFLIQKQMIYSRINEHG